MKITKARLKEIIKEELERAMTPEESIADGHAAAAEMKVHIRRSQKDRGFDAERYAVLRDKLLKLYRQSMTARGAGKATGDLSMQIDALKHEIEKMGGVVPQGRGDLDA